jgi:hypothetical protein
MNSDTGKWVMAAGGVLLLAGVLIYFFHEKMHWIGRLPGDIRIEKENFRFYFPVTTLLVASVVLSLIVRLLARLFR